MSRIHPQPASLRELALYVLGRSARTSPRSPLRVIRAGVGVSYGLTTAQFAPIAAAARDLGCSLREVCAALDWLAVSGLATVTLPSELRMVQHGGERVWVPPSTVEAFGLAPIAVAKLSDADCPSLYQLQYDYPDLFAGVALLRRPA